MRPRLLLPLLLASLAPAQSVLIRVQQDDSIGQIANGGSITVNATGVNQPRTLIVTITYTGATSISFPQAPKLLGASNFSVISPPSAVALGPNQSLSMQLRYLPTSSQPAQAQLDLPLQETSIQTIPTPGNPAPTPVPPRPGLIVLGLNGTVPDYALNYGLALDGNIVNLPAGGTLPFIDTIVNNSLVATMVLVNRGSGAGQCESCSATTKR